MKLNGIVLRTIDYKESSKIVYLYTNEGLKSIKAARAKNQNSGLLGFTYTGNIVSFIATDSSLPSLKEYSILHSSMDYTSSKNRIEVLFIILKILQMLVDDAVHQRIYSFVENIIIRLKTESPKKMLLIFLIKITHSLGIQMNLKCCSKCGSTQMLGFSIKSGGALCKSCGVADTLAYSMIKDIYYNKNIDEIMIDEKYLDGLINIIIEYYDIFLGINIKISK